MPIRADTLAAFQGTLDVASFLSLKARFPYQ